MPRALRNILAVLLTLVLAVGAGAYIYFETRTSAPIAGFDAASGEPLAGAGALAPANVGAIEIATRASGFEIARRDGDWVVASHNDYPAKGELVRDLLADLADTRVLYHRPADTLHLQSYGLRPLTDASSNARRVTVRGPEGASRLALRIGFVVDLPGGTEQETMVMAPAQNRILAVNRALDVPTALSDWYAEPPLDIVARDVARIAIRARPEAATHRFLRDETGRWRARLPDGGTEAVASPAPLDSIATAMSGFEFVDARRDKTFSTPEYDPPYRLTLGLRDGTRLRVQLRVGDSDTWFRLTGAAVDCPEDADANACAGAAERADAISEAMEGWSYRLTISRAAQLHVLPDGLMD